ncbi:DinB family protein [Paludisphaera sp.]|uniref:DinB family protein n=1 Tax=Paludisphaera sp. TaxID=2017432 RepID=UPI00301C23CE
MTAKDLIRGALATSEMIMARYLEGLGKDDLLIRAVPGMNHIAWQVGHLIDSERGMIEAIRPGSSPALPAGFAEAHSRDNASDDDATKFLAPEEYLALWNAQRTATKALLESLPDEELDRADPKFPSFTPTVGQLLHLAANHPVLHAGQFVAVRRKLGLPIAF